MPFGEVLQIKRRSTSDVSRSAMQKRRKKAYELHSRLHPPDTTFSNLRIPHSWRQFQKIEKATNTIATENVLTEISTNCSPEHKQSKHGNLSRSTIDPENIKNHGIFDENIMEAHNSENDENCDSENSTCTDDEEHNVTDVDEDPDSTDDDNGEDEEFDGDNSGDDSTSNDDSPDSIHEETGENSSDDLNGERKVFALDNEKEWSRPMQMKTSVTKLEVTAKILAMSIRGNLTYATTEIMLKNMNSMLVNSTLPCSMESLWSSLSREDEAGSKRHYYCRICQSYMGEGEQPTEECECKACGPNTSNRDRSYFIQLKIAPQLESIFLNPNTVKSLKYRSARKKINQDSVEDIYDGEKYKEHCKPGGFLSNDINFSFTIFTDGCSVSNSSNASAWPILLQINELPPHARKRHMILAGIWVDAKHPDLNMFLLPIIEELCYLHDEGLKWINPIDGKVITSKFITLLCTADSMARAPILNMNLHNGKYGCTYCYAEGKSVQSKGAQSNRRIIAQRRYPVRDTIRCRTDAEMRKHMTAAFEGEEKVFGVKGMSTLFLLPEFDLHSGTDIDSMHNVYLGITKLHTSLLLHGKATDNWYAGSPTQLAAINQRLMKIRPPSRISRKPRPVEVMKNWKASEWRNWLFYYAVPCLEGIIRKCDLEHFVLLSRAMYILNGDSIDIESMQEARLLLKQYLNIFEETFGIINMKYNVHLLNHLVDTVENWGPFWAHSAFPFEAWNKKIIDKVHSANARPLQITTRYLIVRFIEGLLYDLSTPYRVKESVRDILTSGSRKRNIVDDTSESLKFKGIRPVDNRPPCEWENAALSSAGLQPKMIVFYEGAVIHNINYRRDKSNKKETRYCDNIVYCRSISGFAKIIEIVRFNHNNVVINGLFLECISNLGTSCGARHIENVELSSRTMFVNADNNVLVPAMLIATPDNLRAVKLSNIWETD